MGSDYQGFGSQMRLYSCTGYHLAIREDGEVYGTEEEITETNMEISSSGDLSHVRIQGTDTGLYVCFGDNGELYGEIDPQVPGTIFIENFLGLYTYYQSKHNTNWYLGIKKNGRSKNGNRTKLGQKATKFLPRRFN